MANGIQSLLGPDKKKRKYAEQGAYPHILPDTLTGADRDKLPAMYEQQFGLEWDEGQPQTDPSTYLGLLDSISTILKDAESDRVVPKIKSTDEMLDEYGSRSISPYGIYDRPSKKVYVTPPGLFGPRNNPNMDPRITILHEMLGHGEQDQMTAADLIEAGVPKPWGFSVHGPSDMTSNTLAAAFDALSRLGDEDTAYADALVDYMINNYHRYDKNPSNVDKELSRDDARTTLEYLARRNPYNITLREGTLGEKFKRGILSLFGRDK